MTDARGTLPSPRRPGDADAVVAAYEHGPYALASLAGPDLVFTAANAAFHELAGRTRLIGRALRAVFPELAHQQLLDMLEQSWRTGETTALEEWRVQVVRETDGAPVERYLRCVAVPRTDAAGRVVAIDSYAMDVTAAALARRRADREREAHATDLLAARSVLTRLQDVLLPGTVPVLPGLDVEARYVLAGDQATAGGDWFDVVPRPDGTVALVVGDVVGHGVRASATMGQLRAVLRSHLMDGAGVATAVRRLDAYARGDLQARGATLCLVVLDPRDGRGDYLTAGHVPPAVHGPDRLEYLPPTGGGPLGSASDLVALPLRLAADQLLVLTSDGLHQRPGRDQLAGEQEVLEVVDVAARGLGLAAGDPRRPAARVADLLPEVLSRRSGHDDDMTVLVAGKVEPPPRLDAAFGVDASLAAATAAVLEEWLAPWGVRRSDLLLARQAVEELAGNVASHAGAGRCEVGAEVTPGGELHLRVSDDGRWSEPDDGATRSGWGLPVVQGMASSMAVRRSDRGTTVHAHLPVARDAVLLRGTETVTTAEPVVAAPLEVVRTGSARVALRGSVRPEDVDRLRAQLLHAAAGGTTSVHVDLAGLESVASGGIAALHEAVGRGAVLVAGRRLPPGLARLLEVAALAWRVEGDTTGTA